MSSSAIGYDESPLHEPPRARRALTDELPVKIATAVWELLDGVLREEPHRVGKPLREPFAGQWVARRSSYRVRYRIDEDKHAVIVLDVRARADVHRPG